MNVVFMGTPDFAVPSLQKLIDRKDRVLAVFTQSDKPKGRGYQLTPPPVKVLALSHQIPVYQPSSLKKGEDAEAALQILKDLSPDYIIVVAYGKILPKAVLDVPKFSCINVHASLLPKYRGAGPIQWSVLNGESVTGITTMLMEEGIDTGAMLLQRTVSIGKDETASELHDRLSFIGADLLDETLLLQAQNKWNPVAQNEQAATYAPILTKELCPIDFTRPANEVHNQIRGLSNWPCATAFLNGKRLKFYHSTLVLDKTFPGKLPGTIVDEKSFSIVCGDGKAVCILELQAEGGKRLKVDAYLRGNPVRIGDQLQ